MSEPTDLVARHPLLADGALALLLCTLSLVGLAHAEPGGSERAADAGAVVLTLLQTLPLTLRRRAPMAVLVVVATATVLFWVADYDTAFGGVGHLVALYTATAHTPERERRLQYVGGTLALMTLVTIIGVIVPEEDLPAIAVLAIGIVNVTAVILGDNVRTRRAYVTELRERVALAEGEREERARRAVVDERTRIARELHDVVAHSVSVMVVHAGAAARLVRRDPERVEQALGSIADTGRSALDELRQILGVLRGSDESVTMTPQPTLSQLDGLLDHCAETGIPVELLVEGDPQPLPPSVELTAYRVVQEALTNTVKHAGPATAQVQLTYGPDALDIAVVDDGRGAAAKLDTANGGHGLTGMRERVELHGGLFQAGPRPGGGYRVHASIPLARRPLGVFR